MQLKNQLNNQNLISQINNFAKEIKSTGQDPQQLLYKYMNEGRFTKEQVEEAMKKANAIKGLFGN